MADDLMPVEFNQLQQQIRAARGTHLKLKSKLREFTMLVEEADMDLQKMSKSSDMARDVLIKQLADARRTASSSQAVLTGLPLPPLNVPLPPPFMQPQPPPPPPAGAPPGAPAHPHPLLMAKASTTCGVDPAGMAPMTPAPTAVNPEVTAPRTPPWRPPILQPQAKTRNARPPAPHQSKAAMVSAKAKSGPKPPDHPPPTFRHGHFASAYIRARGAKRKFHDFYTPGRHGQSAYYDTTSESSLYNVAG